MREWISVEDRLPIGEDKLLLYVAATEACMGVGYFNLLTRSYIVNGEKYPGLCVTHWQPLPDLPKAAQ